MVQAFKSHRTVYALTRTCKILALISLLGVTNVYAADTHILSALQNINQDRWSAARADITKAKDPFASKLYSWMEFSKRKKIHNFTALAQFIRTNPDWPGRASLIRKAEEQMPSALTPAQIRSWYNDFPPKTAQGVERYIDALIGSGQTPQAQKFLADWWATTSMSREDQRTIFRKYKTLLNRDAHIRRFDTMLYRGADQNARAIAQVLQNGYPQLAAARIALAQENKNVESLIRAVPKHLQQDPGLLYERLRWRRRADLDTGAIDILHKMPPAGHIQNLDQWWRERHILIRRMLEEKRYKAAYALATKHQQTSGLPFAQAEWLAGWLALQFMNKPAEAYKRFSNLYRNVKSPISKARAAYWAGRAAAKFRDQSVSIQNYKIAANFPTVFYGQLAYTELGRQSGLPKGAPPALTDKQKTVFANHELIRAATLLSKARLQKESAQFLNAFVRANETPQAYRFAADTAIALNQLNAAIRISKTATRKGLFLTAQAYPVLTGKMRAVDIEWSLVHGIIRQESMFDFNARSRVGALGLMQLMPATAKETARKLGIAHTTSKLTSNPDHNIRLGSAYLQRMIARFGGSYPLAIAAYNAGPGRVDQWIKTYGDPRTGEINLIDWIELIPIYETRNYVQRVMEATYIYRLRLKGIQNPPQVALHNG